MTDIELRYRRDEKYDSSETLIKSGDGQVGIMFEVEKCYSAWFEFYPTAGDTGKKYIATIIPQTNPETYLPFLEDGGELIVHASVGIGGFFRAKVFGV